MSVSNIVSVIEGVIRNELDDCERAIKRNDSRRALSELDDAIRKLKRISYDLRNLASD